MSPILRILTTMLSLIMLMTAGTGGGKEHDVKEPDACKLNFSILSDSHIEGNNFARYKVFVRCLRDVKKNKSGQDAVVFLGDNTMNGNTGESLLFHGTVSLLLKDETVLPALGNHDIGNGQGDYAALQNRWYSYTKAFFGKKLTVPYYYEVIDGYYFIILGTEDHTVNDMALSEAQLIWLQKTLEEAAGSGKPAFVFSHHPERASFRLDADSPYRLTDILTEYAETNDLFYFSGHTHRTLTHSSFAAYYNFPETSLPCLTTLTGEKDDQIHEGTGFGVDVEVYGSEVVIRGRNYYAGEWAVDSEGAPLEAVYSLKRPAA